MRRFFQRRPDDRAALRVREDQSRFVEGSHYPVPQRRPNYCGPTIERTGFDHNVTAAEIKKILGSHQASPELRTLDRGNLGGLGGRIRRITCQLDQPTIRLLIATGHFRSGILLAPITAALMREWICSQQVSVDWERFSPMRFLEAPKGLGA
jgi:glycine/D-amino acid oxidase-like deaminating enzyme